MSIDTIGRGQVDSKDETPLAAIDSASWNLTKIHKHRITKAQKTAAGDRVAPGKIAMLYVEVSNIGAGASKLQVDICRDAIGDFSMLGEPIDDITLGKTNVTNGTCQFLIGVSANRLGDAEFMYVFFRTNVGTVTVEKSLITMDL